MVNASPLNYIINIVYDDGAIKQLYERKSERQKMKDTNGAQEPRCACGECNVMRAYGESFSADE